MEIFIFISAYNFKVNFIKSITRCLIKRVINEFTHHKLIDFNFGHVIRNS